MGLKTGFIDLDNMLGGLQKGKLYILGARTGMGKTAFAINLARNIAIRNGNKVLFASLEMSMHQFISKLFFVESGFDLERLRKCSDNWEEDKQISKAARRIWASDITVDDTAGMSVEELRESFLEIPQDRRPDVIIIDYFQLMSENMKYQSRMEEIVFICGCLKKMAEEFDVPILALSLISRAVDIRQGHRPELPDFLYLYKCAMEQYVDVVISLYRDDYYVSGDAPKNGIAEMTILKNSIGETGTVYLNFIPERLEFTNCKA